MFESWSLVLKIVIVRDGPEYKNRENHVTSPNIENRLNSTCKAIRAASVKHKY